VGEVWTKLWATMWETGMFSIFRPSVLSTRLEESSTTPLDQLHCCKKIYFFVDN